jgi:hypothetical protein
MHLGIRSNKTRTKKQNKTKQNKTKQNKTTTTTQAFFRQFDLPSCTTFSSEAMSGERTVKANKQYALCPLLAEVSL